MEKQPNDATWFEKDSWSTAFPAPKCSPTGISCDDLMKLFDDMDISGEPKSFLIVDVRREDFEGGLIKGALNLPAQSFYYSRKPLLELCDRVGFKKVIFYCGQCETRGPRCSSWMKDYIDDISKFGRKTQVKISFLEGGIKGWVKEFEGAMMEGFEEKYWKQFK